MQLLGVPPTNSTRGGATLWLINGCCFPRKSQFDSLIATGWRKLALEAVAGEGQKGWSINNWLHFHTAWCFPDVSLHFGGLPCTTFHGEDGGPPILKQDDGKRNKYGDSIVMLGTPQMMVYFTENKGKSHLEMDDLGVTPMTWETIISEVINSTAQFYLVNLFSSPLGKDFLNGRPNQTV